MPFEPPLRRLRGLAARSASRLALMGCPRVIRLSRLALMGRARVIRLSRLALMGRARVIRLSTSARAAPLRVASCVLAPHPPRGLSVSPIF